ncbi:MAG: NTP transferase domain-containing protein [Thermoplasmata archaeon]
MKALIMAGGRGTRIGNPEKCLIVIGNRSLLDRNISLLRRYTSSIYVSVRDGMAATQREAMTRNAVIIKTEGSGYVSDLNTCLSFIGSFPILVIPGDIYVTDEKIFDSYVRKAAESNYDIINFKLNGDFTGLSFFNKRSGSYIDMQFSGGIANINTPEDLEKAEKFNLQ